MNIKKSNIEIYYNNNIDIFQNFPFFTTWVKDNIELLNFNIKNIYNNITYLATKYNELYPLDIIKQLEFFKYRMENFTLPNKPTNETKNLILNKKSILYYKLLNRISLYFWELNQRYEIIQKEYNNLYEININDTMCESITIVNDHYFPLKKLFINYVNMPFLCLNKESINIFENIKKIYSNSNYKNVIFNDCIDFNSYEKYLDKIISIDFIYLSVIPRSSMLIPELLFNIQRMFEFYTFLKIINKINIGGSICIYLNQLRTYNHLKLMFFYCSFFDSYYITYPEIKNDLNHNCFYLILKNKKNIKFDTTKLLNELLSNSPSLGINYKLFTCEIEKEHGEKMTKLKTIEYYENFTEKIIEKINFLDSKNENLYNDFEKEYINIFNILNSKVEKQLNYSKELITQNINGLLTEGKIEEIKKNNIEECKKWAKQYNMPLAPEYNIDPYNLSYQNITFKDIISFENDIYFKFTYYKNINLDITFTTINDFNNLSVSFEKLIKKSREDIRAFDYRNTDTFLSIKKKINYYYKKLTCKLLSNYINKNISNDEFCKKVEILNKIKLINTTKTTLKTFHISEFDSSYINSISFLFNFNNYNVKWLWKAQTLNPKYNNDNIKDDLYNYDFGNDNTGDITKYENIQYYRKNDYDLITVDYNPELNNNQHLLSYSQYLMIFSCCKKEGNAIIKKVFPIENTQELNMLYIFYCLFETMIIYKPKINYHSNEYYLIGLNYKGIDKKLLDKLINFIKDYKLVGFNTNISPSFILEINQIQNKLIENMNKFIKKQIYFCDNFETIKDDEWILLKKLIKKNIITNVSI